MSFHCQFEALNSLLDPRLQKEISAKAIGDTGKRVILLFKGEIE
jgi:hypothetical protein